MKEVQLTLTIEEVKKVMNALSKFAWVDVNDLINKINNQVTEKDKNNQ